MISAKRRVPTIAPPTLDSVRVACVHPITDALDDGWSFADEPAATDGSPTHPATDVMGKPDAGLGEFPPGPSDLEIAGIVDAFTDALCRPRSRGSRGR